MDKQQKVCPKPDCNVWFFPSSDSRAFQAKRMAVVDDFQFCFTVFHLYEPVLTDLDVPIENEAYFRAVDRTAAEDILKDRIDGSCLVRPYKQKVRNSTN